MPSSAREERSGFLVVRKPAGMTSHDVVARVRRRFRCPRVGHAGTLDPMAEGVLILGMGRPATRGLAAFMELEKEYIAVMALGVTTDTQDAEGRALERRDAGGVTEPVVRGVLEACVGPRLQTPPMFSALKRGGERLYRMARKGAVVAREARPIRISACEFLGLDGNEVRFRVVCSRGTYVRTLCADIGEALGCGAHMKGLVRTRVGPFSLDAAVPLEELMRMPREEMEKRLLPVRQG